MTRGFVHQPNKQNTQKTMKMTKHKMMPLRALATMVMMIASNIAWGGTVTDVLTPSAVGSFSSYTDWTLSFSETSGATYKGKSSGTAYINLRKTDNNSGIVTTVSGGKAKKITVTWENISSTKGRILNVYGKNTAYSSPTDLFSSASSTQGKLLGTIVCGTSTECDIDGDYAFIGICVASNTAYFSEISIQWNTGEDPEPISISFPKSSYKITEDEAFSAPQATLGGESADIRYTSSNESVATVNAATGAVTIQGLGTTTITANYAGDEINPASEASYTLLVTEKLETFIWDATEQGYTENTILTTVTASDSPFSITFANGGGNSPTYLFADGHVRFDYSNKISLYAPTGYAIRNITINYKSKDINLAPNIGTYAVDPSDKLIGRWSGISPYVVLSNAGMQAELIKMTVHYIRLTDTGRQVEVTDAGYATFCPSQDVIVGDGTRSYAITGVDEEGVVQKSGVPVVAVGTGVLLVGKGNYTLYRSTELTATAPASNCLVGVTSNTTAPIGSYVLQNQNGVVAFYEVDASDQPIVGAERAYLYLPSRAGIKVFFNSDDAIAASIKQTTLNAENEIEGIYTLNGTKTTTPQQGVNLMRYSNGKVVKVFIPSSYRF